MKVVTRDSVVDMLIQRVREAKARFKVVEYILVSPEEMQELKHDTRSMQYFEDVFQCVPPSSGRPTPDSVFIKTIDLCDPLAHGERQPPYRRFCQYGKFMGYDLYVVPKQFM